MSSYNRKLRKNREAKTLVIDTREDTVDNTNNDMVDVFETYSLPFDFTSEALVMEVSAYNKTIFKSGHMLINSYGLIFKDYIEFCNMNQNRYRIEEFFKDSVENNSSLCDIFKELDFKIVDNKILSTYKDEWEESISFGEFHVDNYKVNVSGSSLYFEDLISGKKFMYYGD
jgi:hypothetical protein